MTNLGGRTFVRMYGRLLAIVRIIGGRVLALLGANGLLCELKAEGCVVLHAPRLGRNRDKPHFNGTPQQGAHLTRGELHPIGVSVELGDIGSGELGSTNVNLVSQFGCNLAVTQGFGRRLRNALAVDRLSHLVNSDSNVCHVRAHSVGDNVCDTLGGERVDKLLTGDVSHSNPFCSFLILG